MDKQNVLKIAKINTVGRHFLFYYWSINKYLLFDFMLPTYFSSFALTNKPAASKDFLIVSVNWQRVLRIKRSPMFLDRCLDAHLLMFCLQNLLFTEKSHRNFVIFYTRLVSASGSPFKSQLSRDPGLPEMMKLANSHVLNQY